MYKDTTAQVRSPDGETDSFTILAGVLEGDTLAPYLFIIALDYALRMATEGFEDLGFTLQERKSSRYPAEMITDTDFADDIALISDNLEKAQKLLEQVESAASQVGLQINSTKTEFMMYNLREGDICTADRTKLKQVQDFQYLGSWVDQSKQDLIIRKAKARLRDRRLRFSGHCWRSKSEIISQMLFWEPSRGKRTRGRPAMTYIDQLAKDTCLPRQELQISWRIELNGKSLSNQCEYARPSSSYS
ncbi:uncharacterized protein LOC115922362 [Strongylocentrotus purpuratus]|uniref:Reverse transcriptase domain-containing protein n=1 Tax=Strongylocentrotus purpuratus TaxID=7668 RepID=A0A7M7SWU1_STRPU|nr:uncharacterized protein LOC115922362 [Strongylocentrotus purpuratus]